MLYLSEKNPHQGVAMTATPIALNELTDAEWDERIRVYEEWLQDVQRLVALDHYYDAWWNKKLLRPGPQDRKAFLAGFRNGLSGDDRPITIRGRREQRIYAIGNDTALAL